MITFLCSFKIFENWSGKMKLCMASHIVLDEIIDLEGMLWFITGKDLQLSVCTSDKGWERYLRK
jgi:hypothetical protein